MALSTTPAKILEGGYRQGAYLHHVGRGNVYLGDETVTAATGFELPGNTIIGPIDVRAGESLWGVRENGTSEMHVLLQGRW